ncbi:MAG: 50S ribosomal protein L29 [bacterium]|nr:50S ribosomal protein L29 [bacterium]
MAKKKDNIKEVGTDELKTKLTTQQETLRVLRFNAQGSKSKNVKEQATLKKSIARIMTQLAKSN